MLRAIGMSRRQVRTMIRYEAVITALIGAILGMVLGIVFAALIAQPLKDEGFTLSYPVGSLIVLLVLAALAGVLAAIFPARRASRLDVLESLQYEYGSSLARRYGVLSACVRHTRFLRLSWRGCLVGSWARRRLAAASWRSSSRRPCSSTR